MIGKALLCPSIFRGLTSHKTVSELLSLLSAWKHDNTGGLYNAYAKAFSSSAGFCFMSFFTYH